MSGITEILNKFVNDHENELFTSHLRKTLENQIIDYIKIYSDKEKYPLESMELKLNNHAEVTIDPIHKHVFNVDISCTKPLYCTDTDFR